MNSFLSTLPGSVRDSWSNVDIVNSFPTFRKLGLSVHDHFVPHHRNNYHPHALSHRVIALVSILAIAVKVASISVVVLGPAATTSASAISQSSIVSLANQARSQNGLGQLTASGLLSQAAQNKANDMLAKQYFAHNSPDGATPWSFIKGVGYSYTTAGENLAIDFVEAETVQAAWMNSPGHRANILNGNFTEIGVGIAKGIFDNHQTTIVVQMFGNPIGQQVVVSPEPTPVENAVPTPTPTPVSSAPQPSLETQPAQPTPNQPVQTLEPVSFAEVKTSILNNDLHIEVEASSSTAQIIAFYGQRSVMLDPVSENIWQAKIPYSSIGAYNNLVLQGKDLNGNLHQEPVAQFAKDFADNFSVGEVASESITVFGQEINPRVWEEKIFLLMLAAIVASLAIAIGVKRHIQHMSLIANTSFAAVLIGMLMLI